MRKQHTRIFSKILALGFVLSSLIAMMTVIVSAQGKGKDDTRPIYGDRSPSETLKVTTVSGNYFLYDDMYIPEAVVKNAAPLRPLRWVNGFIPVIYNNNVTAAQKKAFSDACQVWGQAANIRCQNRTNESDYLVVQSGNKSTTYLGRAGGSQELNIRDWTSSGKMIHLMGHVLGLSHEHMRSDRNTFVRIDYPNIFPYATQNFDRFDSEIFAFYDYDSIMHYAPDEFSSNGKATIVALDSVGGAGMGTGRYPSRRDLLAAMKMYGAWAGGPKYRAPNLAGMMIGQASAFLRMDYGLNLVVTSGPTAPKTQKLTNCEIIVSTPVVSTQTPGAGQDVKFATAINVVTVYSVDVIMHPPPKGEICQ